MPSVIDFWVRIKYKDGQEDIRSSEIAALEGLKMSSALINKKVMVGKYSGHVVGMAGQYTKLK